LAKILISKAKQCQNKIFYEEYPSCYKVVEINETNLLQGYLFIDNPTEHELQESLTFLNYKNLRLLNPELEIENNRLNIIIEPEFTKILIFEKERKDYQFVVESISRFEAEVNEAEIKEKGTKHKFREQVG